MAIYIDNNFYKENRDDETCFKYMYLLAYMLASKSKWFKDERDYDGFAAFLARCVYQRMTDPNKIPVKSVLNYMKAISNFRRLAYLRETFNEVINPDYDTDWNNDLYIERTLNSFSEQNTYLKSLYIEDFLKTVPSLIKKNIPSIYKTNPSLKHGLYISSLLSLLYRITLPSKREKYFKEKIEGKQNFNDDGFYVKHLDKDIIVLWDVPEDYTEVVRLILNKTKNSIISEIREISADFVIDEKYLQDSSKEIIFEDTNGQDYN